MAGEPSKKPSELCRAADGSKHVDRGSRWRSRPRPYGPHIVIGSGLTAQKCVSLDYRSLMDQRRSPPYAIETWPLISPFCARSKRDRQGLKGSQ
jgi:hypothetical protein